MTKPLIYADFINADPVGRLRLNCIGTIQDLARLGVRLQEGLKVSLHDEEMEAEGEVHYSGEERIWVAKIDGNKDQDLLLFLTDYGLIHGGEPENAWLVPGVNYVLETMPPDAHVLFNLDHAPNFSGGRGWLAVPPVKTLLAQLGRPTPLHLSRQDGVTLRVRVSDAG